MRTGSTALASVSPQSAICVGRAGASRAAATGEPSEPRATPGPGTPARGCGGAPARCRTGPPRSPAQRAKASGRAARRTAGCVCRHSHSSLRLLNRRTAEPPTHSALPSGTRYVANNGAAFAEQIIRVVFGYDPHIGAAPRLWRRDAPRGVDAVLRGVRLPNGTAASICSTLRGVAWC
eukprot:gene3251-biopygen14219